ncbi:MAG: crosslink repair DNA glycosylase YcaQ family protein [Candidatus Heimdallarchaeota archaeon]
MKTEIIELSKEDLQKIAIVGTNLHKWFDEETEGIRKVIEKLAMVQLDPLNPAGRNHDLFFSSRLPKYKISEFQQLVYSEKLIFESYFPNLMAISKEYLPLFLPQMKKEFLHKYFQSRLEKMEKLHSGILEEARSFLRENGPSKAADIGEMASEKPEFTFWKTSNLAGMALEMLWILGKAVICERDEHWRKKYDLIESFFDKTLLEQANLNDEEISYYKFLIKQKHYPLINLGKVKITESNNFVFGKKKRLSPKWFERTEEDNSPKVLRIEGDERGYGVSADWENLLKQNLDDEMRAIAPLDPLIWDRELTKRVFDFDYTWEVYKVPKDRIYGYYVYPLLYQGEFIARMEAKYDKKKKNLHIFNLQKEEDFEFDNASEKKLIDLIDRWTYMLSSESVTKDESYDIISMS